MPRHPIRRRTKRKNRYAVAARTIVSIASSSRPHQWTEAHGQSPFEPHGALLRAASARLWRKRHPRRLGYPRHWEDEDGAVGQGLHHNQRRDAALHSDAIEHGAIELYAHLP